MSDTTRSNESAPTPQLTLHDPQPSSPYYNGNVWNGDADGNPMQPTVGAENWCWANVGNLGDATATAMVVQFYFCTPGGPSNQWSDFLNNSAGSTAPQTLAPTQPQHIRAAAPWSPPQGSQGMHTCLLAYASASNDPGPPQTPSVAPQITDAQVAQNNYTIVTTTAGATLDVAFTAPAPGSTLTAELVTAPPPPAHLAGGIDLARDAGEIGGLRFSIVGQGGDGGASGGRFAMAVDEDTPRIMTLRIQVPDDAQPGQQAFIQLEAETDGQVTGGAGYLVTVT